MIVISPAKTLDFHSTVSTRTSTLPRFMSEAAVLNRQLRELDAPALSSLMGVSGELAELNAARNQDWAPPFTATNARQAIHAFKGDVYVGLDIDSFAESDLAYAQRRLRILSGLYGLLRPLDLIQPYRLEMGTGLRNPEGRNLYQFWGNKVTGALIEDMRKQKDHLLVNLASQEYARVLSPHLFEAEWVTPVFRDYSSGQYKVISFFAKKARGSMAAWILKQRVTRSQDLSAFAEGGYRYSPEASTASEPVFLRKASD